jgi:hypothetical protein
MIKRLSFACLALMAPLAIHALVLHKTEAKEINGALAVAPAPQGMSPCFAVDPGMASIFRNQHFGWAQGQDSGRLINNLTYKIGLIFDCSAMNGDQLARSFGTMSSIVAQSAPNPACFNNDAGVVNRDPYAHERWARFKTRREVRDSLVWKAAAAFRCMDRNRQVAFFADMSVGIAKVPADVVGPASSGNCRTESYSLAGVPPARPGQAVTANYTAPSNHSPNDYIGIFSGSTNLNSKRVPVDPCSYVYLTAPGPGEYEIYYVITGSANQMIPTAHLSVR